MGLGRARLCDLLHHLVVDPTTLGELSSAVAHAPLRLLGTRCLTGDGALGDPQGFLGGEDLRLGDPQGFLGGEDLRLGDPQGFLGGEDLRLGDP